MLARFFKQQPFGPNLPLIVYMVFLLGIFNSQVLFFSFRHWSTFALYLVANLAAIYAFNRLCREAQYHKAVIQQVNHDVYVRYFGSEEALNAFAQATIEERRAIVEKLVSEGKGFANKYGTDIISFSSDLVQHLLTTNRDALVWVAKEYEYHNKRSMLGKLLNPLFENWSDKALEKIGEKAFLQARKESGWDQYDPEKDK
jgi:hypothetical protein